MLSKVFGIDSAVVAPGRQDILAIAVPVNVQFDPLIISEFIDQCRKTLALRGVLWFFTLVDQ